MEDEKCALEEQFERETKQQQAQQLTLLTSIPGIGSRTAFLLLAEIGGVAPSQWPFVSLARVSVLNSVGVR